MTIANNNFFSFLLFWNTFGLTIYDETHMMAVARFLIFIGNRFDMIREFLLSETTRSIFKNSTRHVRMEFLQVFREVEGLTEDITGLLNQAPFTLNDEELDLDVHAK